MKSILFIFCFIFSVLSLSAQDSSICKTIKTGYFIYDDDGDEMYIYRTENMQYEWDKDNTMFISGEIKWKEDSCSYDLYLSDFKVIGYPEEYKEMVPEEQLDTFVNLMKGILMDSEIEADILSIDKNGYSLSVKILGEWKEMEMKRISDKKGDELYKSVLKVVKENKNKEKKKRKVESLLKL
ncbi:MAG: hypothetical protein ACI94Y_004223 [Maribacter sp.]|jgi:hypothetical protein